MTNEPILMIVEDTEKMLAKLPIIEMSMALVLARKLGTETVDMKLDKDFCPSCPIYRVPHYHLIGTLR